MLNDSEKRTCEDDYPGVLYHAIGLSARTDGREWGSPVDDDGLVEVGDTEYTAAERSPGGVPESHTIAEVAGWLRRNSAPAGKPNALTCRCWARLYKLMTGRSCTHGEMLCAMYRAEILMTRFDARDLTTHPHCSLCFAD